VATRELKTGTLGTRYLEATLAGTLFWPWRWSQVNVVLRRLDTLPGAAHVRWRHAGLHMHRLTRKALSTTTSPLSRLGPAGQRYPVAAGSKLELFTSGHEPAPDLPDQLEVTAEPYEARGELTLLRLGQPVPLTCDQCATRQTTPWIALRPGQHTPTCRNCFLASHPATGEQGVRDPASSGASREDSLSEASSIPD
jgi:hypothetical protein